jgi:cyclohexadienyl dehydratase
MRVSATVSAWLCAAGLHAAPACEDDGASHLLEDIRARGTLRVGTTLDYAPFSYTDGGVRRGIDIELAELLARDFEVSIEWVTTSWPTLLRDVDDGRFDVAMSGVSITDERRAHGCFTDPYLVTGKTVLARCDAAKQFTSLAEVDRDNVRVIVNPGGTNARFAESHLQHATIVRHPDNVTIFATLAAGDADVMITDAIEAERIAREVPALCAPIPDTYFENVSKALFVPRDTRWHGWLNDWLDARQRDGTLTELFRRFGVRESSRVPAGQ